MYGSEETDLVVKYYDLAFGITGDAELAWYLEKAKASGGPVLDVACGTGRLAIALAREGLPVTGMDHSEGMLNRFREKLRAEPADVRQRIRIEKYSMSDFSLGRRFNTVICCDAFFHNLTVEEEIGCLTCVAQHLTPDGRFVFNLHNPNCEFILKCAVSRGKTFDERGRYELEDGSGTLLVEQADTASELDQRTTTTLRFTRYDTEGNEVESGESNWSTRYLFRWEAVHLLYRCGLRVEALVGDYGNGPVTEGSQLVFEARRSGAALPNVDCRPNPRAARVC